MKNDKDYTQAIKQAKDNMDDVNARGNEAIGDDALTFMDNLLTPEEIWGEEQAKKLRELG